MFRGPINLVAWDTINLHMSALIELDNPVQPLTGFSLPLLQKLVRKGWIPVVHTR